MAPHLPWVLLALRVAPHEDSNTSPAEAVYGAPLVLPGQFPSDPEGSLEDFLQLFRTAIDRGQHLPVRQTKDKNYELPAELLAAEMVFVRRDESKQPLSPSYAGPYKVVEQK